MPARFVQSPQFILGVTFAAGALLGWLIIGWWLLPASQNNSAPWQLDPFYQRSYVSLVAERYWRTSDVTRLEKDLAGWNRADLTNLLATMLAETPDAETRQHLAALARALQTPNANQPLWMSLVRQPIFVLAVLLSAASLLAAAGLLLAPARQPREVSATLRRAQGGLAQVSRETEKVEQEIPGDAQIELEAREPLVVQPPVEQEEEEELSPLYQSGIADFDYRSAREHRPREDNRDVTSLFEEDASVATLESLSRGLAEISMDELLAKAADAARRLHAVWQTPPRERIGVA